MEINRLKPYQRVLYKEDDLPGWKMALLIGNQNIIDKKCKKLWKNYIIYQGGEWANLTEDDYSYQPPAWMMHQTTNLVYSTELDKWFLPEESIPIPSSKCYNTNVFNISYVLDENFNTVSELKYLYEESCCNSNHPHFNLEAETTVKTNTEDYNFTFLYSKTQNKDIDVFLNNISNGHFAKFIIEEYYQIKILVWSKNGICRVVFQNYDGGDVKVPIQFEIEINDCISVFKTFFNKLKSEYESLERQVFANLNNE